MEFTTYVINLDTQPHRLKHQSVQLAKVGIYPRRFPAFQYDDISEESLEEHFTQYGLHFTAQSAIACAYSHKMACKKFLEQDTHNVALIIEDDAYPLFTDVLFLKNKLHSHPEWDMLFLHCESSVIHPLAGSAAAYFITKKGAQKIIERRMSTHYDIETNMMPNMKKKIDEHNSFWTDENGIMSNSTSTNRENISCDYIPEVIISERTEKSLCQGLSYSLLRIPILNMNISNKILFPLLIVCCLILLITPFLRF